MIAEESLSRSALYIYGIVAARSLDDLPEGVGGATVDTVESGRLAALVSPLPDAGVQLRRRELRRHLSVIERAFATTTILPCPFGTLVADEQMLKEEVLSQRSAEWLQALERLRGRSQFNVKAEYDEEPLLREVVREQPAIRRLRDEARRLGDAGHFARIRLGELVAEALRARRAQDAAQILSTLQRAAEEAVLEDGRSELTLLKGAFLVADVERFDRVLEGLAEAGGGLIRYESIGPLPPTAFAAEAAGVGG